MTTGQHRPAGRSPLPLLWLIVFLALAAAGTAFLSPDLRARLLGTGPGERTAGPTAAPSVTATPVDPSPARGELVIHGTGDVNVDPSYIPNLATYGHEYAWSGLGGLFRRDDLTIINLECAVSALGTAVPKQFNFRGDPAALPVMRAAGVEVANLGNNHAYDYGPEALIDTRKNLIANDIAPVGGGRDEREATQPALFEIDGWTVAVVGIGHVVEPESATAGPGHPGVACNDDVACMTGAIERASELADLVFVSIHWGIELETQPSAETVALAHAFVDAGADAIFGHHSHRLNPMGTYKGRPIFWGLGNFVWPDHSVEGATTAVAEVRVSPAGKLTGRLLPAFIESAGHPVLRNA
jgi:poly-gamma-glutamate synthesis protein (capsule biosynthesis protein)